jgi:hypothetical protein
MILLVPIEPEPFDETLALIERHGWEQTNAEQEDDPPEWHAPKEDADIRWVVDDATGVQYFELTGAGREPVAKQIEAEIPLLEPSGFAAYLDQFRSGPGLMRGLYAVGTAAPEQADAKVIALLERYFAHDDQLIRRTALIAASITRWPEFADSVRPLLQDADPDVQRVAEATLRALRDAS